MVPGVFNPLVARLAEQAGFPAVYLSGAALSASYAVPDVGLLTLTEFVNAAAAIVDATPLPLISDADTGFGEALNVERTVRQFENAGVAGIHLEDQEIPKRCGHLSGKSLVSQDVMCAKLRAAVAARRDPGFVIIARTDARGVTSFEDAVLRAHAYFAAGADMIFVEALQSAEEFAAFAQRVKAPLLANMTEFGKSQLIDFADLAQMGYRIVIYPVTLFRIIMQTTRQALAKLKQDGHQRALVPQMLTRQELYDLLGYTGYEERDKEYFSQATSPALKDRAKLEKPPEGG
jgi:methylisocitrate lyase